MKRGASKERMCHFAALSLREDDDKRIWMGGEREKGGVRRKGIRKVNHEGGKWEGEKGAEWEIELI